MSEGASLLVPLWMAGLVTGIALVFIVGLARKIARLRRELAILYEQVTPPGPYTFSDWHPDRRADLAAQLAEAQEHYKQLYHHYTILATRHKKLVDTVRQQRPPVAPRSSTSTPAS